MIPAEKKQLVGGFEKELKTMLVKNIKVPRKEARELIEDNLINVRLLTKLANFVKSLTLIKLSSISSRASFLGTLMFLTNMVFNSFSKPPTSCFFSAGIKTKVSKTFELNLIV